ncbi:hypothetical protein ACIRUY_17445 [Streptomyces erythrochromogenes]|uniref:hypothetical protein n=1 Tax=Streptomyces erythrochromogenes TaxID=285574 RepID=UPI003814C054
MAGRQNDNHDIVLFGESCADLAPIPTSIIESVQPFGWSTCNGHSHPLVELRLKEPQSEEGKAYAKLATSPSRVIRYPTAPIQPPATLREDVGPTPSEWDYHSQYLWGVWCQNGHGCLSLELNEFIAWDNAWHHWASTQAYDDHGNPLGGGHTCYVRRMVFGGPSGGYYP